MTGLTGSRHHLLGQDVVDGVVAAEDDDFEDDAAAVVNESGTNDDDVDDYDYYCYENGDGGQDDLELFHIAH